MVAKACFCMFFCPETKKPAETPVIYLPYSLKLTLQVINAKMNFFALILGPLIIGDVNFGGLNFLMC